MKIITASLLESYGAFLPFYKVGTWRGSKLQIREKPLLTRYVLVNLPENAAWGSINEADGVNRVLLAGEAPFSADRGSHVRFVERISDREAPLA